MEFSWAYPVHVIRHGGGYAALVDPDPRQTSQLLVVFTDEATAERFAEEYGLEGPVRALRNGREFGWLLQSLQEPVRRVAFDPEPSAESVGASWVTEAATLLEKHITADYSPWNYPVFVVRQDAGFASIAGQTAEGHELVAVGVFTSNERAEQFLRDAQETGRIEIIADMEQARAFLEDLSSDVVAVALDPQVSEQARTARYCFSIETLLARYLVRAS